MTVALVGKYTQLHDAYISVVEALKHGAVANRAQVHIKWVDSETVTSENVDEKLEMFPVSWYRAASATVVLTA